MARRASQTQARAKPAGGRRNREREVLKAGTDIFWRDGYSAATMQDIADAVGVLKGSLYHYTESKEELLFRIFDDAHQESVSLMAEVADADLPPLERLGVYLERYIEQFLKSPERTSLYFRDWRYLTGDRLETVVAQRNEYERYVRDLVVAGQEAGEIDPSLRPRYAALFIIGAVNNVAEWYRREGRDSARAIATANATLALRTLRADGAESGS